MPLSYKQAGNLFIAGPNITIYSSGNTYAISGNATSTGTTGFSALTSAGTGNILILSSITNNTLFYKSLTGTSNLSINDNDNGTLTFSLAGSGIGTIISGINLGTNANSISFFSGLSTTTNPNDTLVFRNLLAGDNITIAPSSTNDGDILISRGSPILVNQILNIGNGARVLSAISTSNIIFARSLLSTTSFTTTLRAGIISTTSSTSSDATSFITAASITNSRQITAIENLVSDLKTNNLWDKMYAIYPFVGGTSVNNHKYNLKDPRDLDAAYRLVFSGSWGFNDLGISGTTSNFANTFFNPFSSSSVSQNSIHISIYIPSPLVDSTSIMGSLVGAAGGSNALQITRSVNHGATVNGGNSNDFIQIGGGTVSGHMIGNRTSSTVANTWLNGTKAATNTTASITPPNFNIYLGARNQAGTATISSSRQIRFASIGSGLTDSDAVIFNTIVESYQATLGRQVVTLQNTVVNISPLTSTTANRLFFAGTGGALTVDTNFQIDNTVGSLGIGNLGVSTTSRLLLAAGTASISQLRLTPFATTITSPIDGDIWYSTSGNTLKFYKNNIDTDFIFKYNNNSLTGVTNSILQVNTAGTISQRYVNSLGLFNALSSITSADTASEISIISSNLIGSNTLIASTNPYNPQLVSGRKYRFNARGTLSFDVSPVNLNIRIKLDSIIISSSSTISISIEPSYTSEIEIDTTFTIRNSGLIVGSGKIIFSEPPSGLGGDPVIFGIYSQNATIDTASDKVFDCTAQLDVADASNTITINESTLEILN
jgi:hypothetical protein